MAWLCVEWTSKKCVYVCVSMLHHQAGPLAEGCVSLQENDKKKKDSKRKVEQNWFYLHMLAATEASAQRHRKLQLKESVTPLKKKRKCC